MYSHHVRLYRSLGSLLDATLGKPRHACAARVVSVTVCGGCVLALQATRRLMSDTNSISKTSAQKLTSLLFSDAVRVYEEQTHGMETLNSDQIYE